MQMTVAELNKKILNFAPAGDSDFVESVGGDCGMILGKALWTGWKADTSSLIINLIPSEIVEVPEDHPFGYVGQWVLPFKDSHEKTRFAYVNLPGFEMDTFLSGESFDIGEARVYADTPLEELEHLIEEGYRKITEFVAKEISKG